MLRTFLRTQERKSAYLNGIWQFCLDSKNEGLTGNWAKTPPKSCISTTVPSCWNFHLGFFDYMGAAWYFKRFTLREDSNIRLIFGAVTGYSKIFVDGKSIGEHDGSFTGFHCDLPNIKPGEHLLSVRVDNTLNMKDTLPLKRVDWYPYGGIYRDVVMEEFATISIDNMRISCKWNKLTPIDLWVEADIKNWTKEEKTEVFSLSCGNKEVARQKIRLNPGRVSTIKIPFSLKKIDLWSIQNPKLYLFTLSCSVDDLNERTGFRKIETRGKKLLLNGKEIFLKGINRHQENPETGFAVPGSLMLRDIEILTNLGCNTVRGSHYPNDPFFLDLCDENGLLFWEEIPLWNHPKESLGNARLQGRALNMLREMVIRDLNHPSIVIWGLQNESASDSREGRTLFAKMAKWLRAYDASRLISYASNRPYKDISHDLADIVSWNAYFGWYQGQAEDWPGELKRYRNWLKKIGQARKPFVITEFGAGAILGDRSFDEKRKWSEEYQAEVLDKTLSCFLKELGLSGVFIWHLADVRTSSELALMRPRSFNNKGLLNEHRKPKEAYFVVKGHYTKRNR